MPGYGGASLYPLILPSHHNHRGSDSNNSNDDNNSQRDDTSIRGWDHSIITEFDNNNNDDDEIAHPNSNNELTADDNLLLHNKRSNITFHALAIDNVVFGTSSTCCASSHSPNTATDAEEDDANGQQNSTDDNSSSHQDSSSSDTPLIKWQTVLPSSTTITTLATNNNGSIIAIATSNNEVSLLKGCDGSILATRQIGPSPNANNMGGGGESVVGEETAMKPKLFFLSNSYSSDTNSNNNEEPSESNSGSDTLVIICPPSLSSSNQSQSNEVILISNIYGCKLNSNNIEIVKEGASLMIMEALPISSSSSLGRDGNGSVGYNVVSWMDGVFVNSNTIRFFIQYYHQPKPQAISVVDYNIHEKKMKLVLNDLGCHLSSSTGGQQLIGLGIDTTNCHSTLNTSFLLVAYNDNPSSSNSNYCNNNNNESGGTNNNPSSSSSSSTTMSIAWINILNLTKCASYTLPTNTSLLDCIPLKTSLNNVESSVAIAIACRRTSATAAATAGDDKVEINVVQSLISTTGEEGEQKELNDNNNNDAMVLFTIEVGNNNGSGVDLCAPSSSNNDSRGIMPYVFRYLNNNKSNTAEGMMTDEINGNNCCCWEFVPNEHEQLGKLHGLLTQHDYEGALSLLDQIMISSTQEAGCEGETISALTSNSGSGSKNRVSSPMMNKSFISLRQFQHVLSKPLSDEGNANEAKESLKRLAKCVILSGGDSVNDIENMCSASKFLMNWPKNQIMPQRCFTVDASASEMSIQEVIMALLAMSSSLTSVINVIGPSKSTLLEEQRIRLDERHLALDALSSILPSLEGGRRVVTFDDPFLAVESVVGLLKALVKHGAFKLVSRLQTCEHVKKATTTSPAARALLMNPDVIATSALHIPMNIHPSIFIPWLCNDVVLPSLCIGHPLLGQIRSWACNAADYYDEHDLVEGIDLSISLLTAVSKATARLTVAMNNCYTYPMQMMEPANDVDGENSDLSTPRNDNNASSFGTSFDTNSSMRSVRSMSSRPTVLNIGMISGMKRKDGRMMSAQRVTRGNVNNTTSLDFSFFNNPSPNSVAEASFVDEDDDDESVEYDCVEYKLNEAIRLKTARSLGLNREVLTLANYSSKGEQYIVKELVKSALKRSSLEDHADTVNEIRAFAVGVDADFDEAVHHYANELCDDNRDNIPHALQWTQTLSQWCSSPSVRCTIVLKMLRIALVSVQRPPDLTGLAKETIEMAVDENVKSELEEAFRLLGIDSLVRRYCGNGAQEFFRVSDPSHGVKLVQHVCRHIDTSTVLADALMLTDAFTHVSKVDTCLSILQRTMVAAPPKQPKGDRAEQCASFMTEIYSYDAALAEIVGERMAGFCAGILEDCRKMILDDIFPEEAKRQAIVASSSACAMLSVMEGRVVVGKRGGRNSAVSPRASNLLKEFQKISKLQSGCDMFLTIEELRNQSSCATVVSDLLQPSVDLLRTRKSLLEMEDESLRNELKPLVATARQWCAVLCECPRQMSQIWARAIGAAASQVAKISTNHGSLLLLEVSGLLDERNDHSSFHAIMSVALTLCSRAFQEAKYASNDEADSLQSLIAMRCMAQASLLLNEHLLLHSPSSMLSATLSLGNLMELVCGISVRSDMGIGEKLERYIGMLQAASRKHRQPTSRTPQSKHSVNMLADKRLPPAPNLHLNWYIGDGLLLPPFEALSLSMSYCKTMLDIESRTSSSSSKSDSSMLTLLESRGAHATSLRVLMLYTTVSMSQSSSLSSSCTMFANVENMLKQNTSVLAERSLGGTESGLTSGNIDELMSVSFLLHLPKELAFNIYQAALPSAIGKRDFSRILTLASVGTFCGVGAFSSGEPFPWNKQRRFIEQCDELSCNAIWWSVLSNHRVSFDPSVFSQSKDSKSSVQQTMQGYCEKLVWNATKKLGPSSTLLLARRFVKGFSLNKHIPPSTMIEYLLSAPHDTADSGESAEVHSNNSTNNGLVLDIRRDLNQTESAVRECLALLPTINRSIVLRKCVMNLEKDHRCAFDYDRHSLLLQLYRECLDKLSGVMKKSDARARAHEEETWRIERRQDALVIISSMFEQYPPEKKPEYIKMFQPLPRDPSHVGVTAKKSSVLGAAGTDDDIFDPLSPLDEILDSENGSNNIVAALAPLCSLLQLPSGYLHARSLVVRFNKLKAAGSLLPSFDTAVVPVTKKLRNPRDKADLCWWCSLQYNVGSVEQLKCLDMAHANATEASEEAESSKDVDEERAALERVKRIDAARAGLSDKILVDEVLKRHISTSTTVKELYKTIIDKVQQRAQAEENYCPEHLVKALLVEGSLIASIASLDDSDGFATHHFRLLALLVHDACKSLSNRYSHVNVGKIARLLTRRWLVHGDEDSEGIDTDLSDDNADETEKGKEEPKKSSNDEELDDTSEFELDMNIVSGGSQTWSNDSTSNGNNGGITSTQEASALSPSSLREISDCQCGRVALRISFLICFAEDYHCQTESSPEKGNENTNGNAASKRQSRPKREIAQKARHKTNCFEGDLALQHARELLGIVFARQGSTIASTYGFLFDESSAYDMSILSTVPEDATKEDFRGGKSKALSFAMRHRALRVATILCPQDVITRVVVEEMYTNDVGDDHLNKCAFGSFVAYEIEAMGLPLPHSDLVQLSAMHFPSYARTIWRNHGASSSSRCIIGRLHLLLLELCVNHHDNIDWELFVLIFSELERLELPRSLLLACECAVQSRAVALAASQKRKDVLQRIEGATKKICELIVREVQTNLGAGIELDEPGCLSTMHRLISIINVEDIHADPTYFVEAFSNVSRICGEIAGQETVGDVFTKAALRIANHLTDTEIFCKASSVISIPKSEYRCVERNEEIMRVQKTSVCSEAIISFERSFH